MKIGIDCRTILNPNRGEQGGIGQYTYHLVKGLLALDKKNQYFLFFDNRFKQVKEFEQVNVKIRFFPFYQYKKYLPLTYSQLLISAFISRDKLDVFHALANTLPLPYRRPAVVTVHNLAINKYPKFFPTQFLNRQIFATRVLMPRSLKKAEKIIAVSKSVKKDIVEEFGIEEEKIEVVYNGVIKPGDCLEQGIDSTGVKEKYGLSDKYFLFLGTIEPRKNLVSLIKAFRNLRLGYNSPAADCQLVLAGAPGWKDAPVFAAISDANAAILGLNDRRNSKERRSGLDRRSENLQRTQGERRRAQERRSGQPIKHLGYVSHEEKIALICGAAGFIFPSLYEGFGLPVLEAMSLGAPVITSNNSSLPEITGENGALLINPIKENELAEAMAQILTDEGLRESLKINGKKRAAEFNWSACAEKTLEVYREVMGKN